MRSVVKFSIRQSVFINVVFVILVISGAFSILTSPVENMPNVDIGKVFIHTIYFGASAEDVEHLVTKKIEDALDGMEDVEYIQSKSYRNYSSVQVKFIDDKDYKDLFDELRFRILNIKEELPAEAEDSRFLYIDTHVWLPVVVVNLTGNLPQHSLKLYADDLKSRLINIPRVRNVDISGEYEKEFHVSIDPSKLRRYGITFNQVADAVQSANTKVPTGRFKGDTTQYMLDAGQRLSSQEEVLEIVVRRDGDGSFIRVGDLVTSARISHRDPTDIDSVNGENALLLRVLKEDAGNAVDISAAVKRISREFEKRHKEDGIRVVFTNDSTYEINDSVKTLGGNLILGMGLVLIVLWITLGFRNSLMTAVGIPFAFLCTFTIMKIMGVSINTISLFAFVLVTGIMVDDAVIIVENIHRHFQMGKPLKAAVIDGTAEVMLPVISSALTTILAFLPMLIMTGSTGDFFALIPETVSFALFASLIEALFILPIHVLDWGPKKHPAKSANTVSSDPYHHLRTGLFAPMWKAYRWLVTFLLNHKAITFIAISALFFGSIAILFLSITGIKPLIKVKFFPGNYFRYHVTLEMPIGTTIETTDREIRAISRFIMSLGTEQAQSASGSAGFYEDEDYQHHSGHHFGQIVVTLPEEKDRNFPENPSNDPMQHLEFMRKRINKYVSSRYENGDLAPKVKIFEESDGPPTGKAVNIRVTAFTLEDALKATESIMAFMRSSSELSDLIELDDDRPEYQKIVKYTANQEAAFEYGLAPGQITALVAGALNGRNVGKYRTLDEEIDLQVRLTRADDQANPKNIGLSHPMDILDVPVIEHSSSPIKLRDLVDARYGNEPGVRARYQGKPTITITSNIREGAQKLSPARVQVLVNDYFENTVVDQFPGVSVSFGGEFESTSRSYTSLTFAFLIAILGIYMVLASQFNSYIQPMIIITAVAFSLIGVVMGLFISRTIFTIGSFMAIVGLAGVAVNDSLLLIDFMNARKDNDKSLREAIIESCAARMRPVLITTVTTMLGLLPMAIGIPRKSISWAPMATAFVAGLCSATILALLIIPVEYEFFENIKSYFSRKKKERSQNEK